MFVSIISRVEEIAVEKIFASNSFFGELFFAYRGKKRKNRKN